MLNSLLATKRKEKKILLLAGHHRAGYMPRWPFWHDVDPGAVAHGTNEHYEMEKITYQAKEILEQDGFDVALCPFDYDLRQKIDWANTFHEDSVLMSCHMNAASPDVSGVECWYQSGNKEMENTADAVCRILSSHLNLRNRYPKGDLQSHHGRLGVLRDTKQQDELLLELGFITNAKDLEALRARGAQAVADACKQVFYFKNK